MSGDTGSNPLPKPKSRSLWQMFTEADDEGRMRIIGHLGDSGAAALAAGAWWTRARPEQLAPEGDWSVWLVCAGRGFGKSRLGAEWLAERVIRFPRSMAGAPTEWCAIGEKLSDVRETLIEGESGLLEAFRRHGVEARFRIAPQMRLDLPDGQKIFCRGADDSDVGRGWNLAGGWLDEIAKWPMPKETWTNGLLPALRTKLPGEKPRVVVTSTPKPIQLLRDWMKRTDGSVALVRGSTYDNAENLSAEALEDLRNQLEGTRLGRQELYGELLEDFEGALWKRADIDNNRVAEPPSLVYKVVAVDPAVTVTEHSDETGIIVVGLGIDGHEYVLADHSGKIVGMEAARKAWNIYLDFGADELVVEENQGKQWVTQVFTQAWRELTASGAVQGFPPIRMEHAKIGKRLRAEPAAARYEQGRVHHVGFLHQLEDQMYTWEPEAKRRGSPDRIDALVHGLARLGRRLSVGTNHIASAVHINRHTLGPQHLNTGSTLTPIRQALVPGELERYTGR